MKQMRWQSYGRLLWGWLIENHAPHTDWTPEELQRRAGTSDQPTR